MAMPSVLPIIMVALPTYIAVTVTAKARILYGELGNFTEKKFERY